MVNALRKNFGCGVCGVEFWLVSTLNRHISTEHGNWSQKQDEKAKDQEREASFSNSLEEKSSQVVSSDLDKGKSSDQENITELDENILESRSDQHDLKLKGAYVKLQRLTRTEIKKHCRKTRKRLKSQETFACSKCDKTFHLAERLQIHNRTAHGKKKTYECESCDKTFRFASSYKIHIKTEHKDEKRYQCDLCDKTFSFASNLQAHNKNLHSDSVFECKIRAKIVKSATRLKPHEKNNETKSKTGAKNKRFASQLKTKGKSSQKRKKTTFHCKNCDKSFSSIPKLRAHAKNFHGEKRLFQCKICPLEFETCSGRFTHTKIVHDKVVFKCNVCGKHFRGHSGLRQHKKSVHEKLLNKCELCDKIFRYESGLREHLKSVHVRAYLYQCSVCDFLANRRDNAYAHYKAVHKGFEPVGVGYFIKKIRNPKHEVKPSPDSRLKALVALERRSKNIGTSSGINSKYFTMLTMEKPIVKLFKLTDLEIKLAIAGRSYL